MITKLNTTSTLYTPKNNPKTSQKKINLKKPPSIVVSLMTKIPGELSFTISNKNTLAQVKYIYFYLIILILF